ncbi:MAG: asparagine synthase, partial [Nitrospirae bacterium]
FSSEIKSISAYCKSGIDYDGVVEYFTFQNLFSDRTLWHDIKALPPGHYLEIDLKGNTEGTLDVDSQHKNLISARGLLSQAMRDSGLRCRMVQYWDFDFFREKFTEGYQTLVHSLEEVFESSVKRQLISDVEVGSYLSGGMDSGSITAIASKHFKDKRQSFKTFTIGFDLHSASGLELSFDERQKAEHMSYLFGTEHYEMVLKAGDMERCLPSLVYHLEEPRVGQSYPNYYASKLASRFVKVVLSGCGGDEIFGGYPWRYMQVVHSSNFDEFVERSLGFWQRLFPGIEHEKVFSPIKDKVTIEPKEVFHDVFPESMRYGDYAPETVLEMSLYFESKTFLHGLLVVEDKLSMAHSLETRVPFLDNEMVDFAMKVPAGIKVRLSEKEVSVLDHNNQPVLRTNKGKILLR